MFFSLSQNLFLFEMVKHSGKSVLLTEMLIKTVTSDGDQLMLATDGKQMDRKNIVFIIVLNIQIYMLSFG